MAGAIVCSSCGAKTKEGRLRCPRCGELQEQPAGDGAASTATPNAGAVPAWLLGLKQVPVVPAVAALSVLVLIAGISLTRQGQEEAAAPVSAPAVAAPVPQVQPATSTPVMVTGEPATSFDFDRLGAAAYAKGDMPAALQQFETAVAQNPNDPTALNNLGQVLTRAGRPREAIPHFLRATELSPSMWAPRFNLARAYGELGEWDRATTEYQRAADIFPDDYVTQYNLGLAYHKRGQEEPAVAAFQRAIALAPSEPSFLLSLGISYEALNRKAEAAKAYEDYLAMDPAAPDAPKIKAHIETLRKPA